MKYQRTATGEIVDVEQFTGHHRKLRFIAKKFHIAVRGEGTGLHVQLNPGEPPQLLNSGDYIFVSEIDGLNIQSEEDFEEAEKVGFFKLAPLEINE